MENKEITREEANALNWINSARVLGVKWKDFKQYLLDNNYIYITKSSKKINCYDKFSTNNGSGLFYKKIDIIPLPNGITKKDYQTKITIKGIEYFKSELKKEGLI